MQGLFIQLGARAKRKMQQQIDHLLSEIIQHEQTNPIQTLSTKLHTLLLENFERNSRRLKMTYYASGKKANKWLARCLQGYRNKGKNYFFLHHPLTKQKVLNPQKIVDAFSCYYSSLYNLFEDPTDVTLRYSYKIHLLTLSHTQLEALNAFYLGRNKKSLRLPPY